MTPVSDLYLTGDEAADTLLARDDNALLIGMLLDQQVPMEKAFRGPQVIAERMGGVLDLAAIAASDEEEFVRLCSTPPAIHRFPGSMAKRVRQCCQVLVERYGGQAANVWRNEPTGTAVRAALSGLPGFGPDKAAIFTALLGKRRGVTPSGWREAAGVYGEPDTFRSVADIVDADSLRRVRETKQQVKAQAKVARQAQNPAAR